MNPPEYLQFTEGMGDSLSQDILNLPEYLQFTEGIGDSLSQNMLNPPETFSLEIFLTFIILEGFDLDGLGS